LPWSRRAAIELPLPPDLQSAGSLVAETAHGSLPVQLFGPPGRRRAIVVIELPGFGAKKVRLRPGKAFVPASSAASADHRAIENEFYRIEVAPNGTIDVLDRITGQRWSGAHWFQDEGDRGDEYSFCPVEGDTPFDSRSCEAVVRVKARGPHVAELEISSKLHLPKKLAATRRNRIKTKVCIPVKTIVRLIAGVNRIEFTTTVLNRARDHRLRVFFPSPGSGLTVQAEGHFAVLRRPAQPVWNGQWREPPAKTHHTLGGVAAGKLALFGIGLPEYEAVPNDAGGVDLALTLLRSVGWLGCSDLSTRPGAQEPHIPTPGAQCLGSHSFSYAVALRESWAEVDLIRASQDFRFGFAVGPGIVEPAELLSVEGDGFATSALKGAEDGNGAILRIYNPGAFPTVASVHGRGLSFMRCRLDETNTSQDETGVVALRPGEIVTLRVTSKQAAGIRHEAQGSRTQHSALNTRDGALNTQGDYNGR
ncbi:MAG: glycoside hydrolase family 38 C-terminal domain-containing protein, partial [Chloroflexota bacterium]